MQRSSGRLKGGSIEGRFFEPAHGSAPDIAGKGIANPIAAILLAAMMADWLGEKKMARDIEAAVAAVIKEGKVRTPDMGGKDTTIALAKAVANKLQMRI